MTLLCIFTLFVAQFIFIANNLWYVKNNIHIVLNKLDNKSDLNDRILPINVDIELDDEVVTTLLNLEILIPLIIFVVLLLFIILLFFVLCNTERSNAIVNVINSFKGITQSIFRLVDYILKFDPSSCLDLILSKLFVFKKQ